MIGYNTKGTKMKIIAERSKSDFDVEFLDEHHYVKEHVTSSNFNNGQVKNPYDASIFDNGYLGVGKYKTEINKNKKTDEYTCWTGMFKRCYCRDMESDKFTSYKGIAEVCHEWYNFQNFAEWFNKNKYNIGKERIHVDKDIKYPGNKIYSPYHCILVPQGINEQFKESSSKTRAIDSDLPLTIRRKGSEFSVSYRGKNLGIYDNVEKCIDMYRNAKRKYVTELIGNYKTMPDNVKEIILTAL